MIGYKKSPLYLYFLLSACSVTPSLSEHSPPSHPALPITTRWHTWQCREDKIAVRYQDKTQKTLLMRRNGHEHTLQYRPSSDPVIYENRHIAFFSNGKTAIIALPAGSEIFLSGCRP